MKNIEQRLKALDRIKKLNTFHPHLIMLMI